MLFGSLIIVILIFAVQAIRTKQLITSALWLAGVSALCSVLFFLFGAQLVAVIELSVGAGLVTVLFVFAISVAGDDALNATPVPPRSPKHRPGGPFYLVARLVYHAAS